MPSSSKRMRPPEGLDGGIECGARQREPSCIAAGGVRNAARGEGLEDMPLRLALAYRWQRQPGIAAEKETIAVATRYSIPKGRSAKRSAIEAILESEDVMVFWFPSGKKAGCYAFKARWDDWTPEFFPTLEYRQAEDLVRMFDPFSNGQVACTGSKKELDYWLAEARRMERRQAAAA